jgi:hypothetical protein
VVSPALNELLRVSAARPVRYDVIMSIVFPHQPTPPELPLKRRLQRPRVSPTLSTQDPHNPQPSLFLLLSLRDDGG